MEIGEHGRLLGREALTERKGLEEHY